MCKPTSNNSRLKDDNSKNRDLWIFDGGTGREIQRRGGPFRQPEWSALALYENPKLVRDIHRSFIKAGATAVTTNTYAIVPFHLGQERYDRDRTWLLKLAVDMALQAKGDIDSNRRNDIQVLGSIPPISGSYQPGSFDKAIAGPIIRDFLEAFRDKVDAIILETMGSAEEAKFALEQIQESGIHLPVYLSFYVQDNARLLTGDTLTEAIHHLQQFNLLQPDRVPLVMVNCCDIHIVDQSLNELASVLDLSQFRIGAYPNAFSAPPAAAANVKAREVNENISPALLRSLAQNWIEAYGATVIGGCCGIGPEHIQAVAKLQQSQRNCASRLLASINSTADPTSEKRTPATNGTVVVKKGGTVCCKVQGCGCGVQIGFGQQPPQLCQYL